jgi:FkbM family methyltransferase
MPSHTPSRTARPLARALALAEFARAASHLSARPADRVRGALVAATLPVRRRVGALRDRPAVLPVEVGSLRRTVKVRDRSQILALIHVLGDREYAHDPLSEVSAVLDLGSHVGASVLFFRDRYPDAEILAVEPDPSTVELLRANVGDLPAVTVLHAAVTRHSGEVDFYPSHLSWGSSLSVPPYASGKVRVPAVTMRELLSDLPRTGRLVLKIDVEGAEWDVLEHADALARFHAVIGELHFGDRDPDEFYARFSGFSGGPTLREPTSHVFAFRRDEAATATG